MATYRGQDQMMRALQAPFIALFTLHGTGLNMLALTTPDNFASFKATLESLATTVKAKPPQVDQRAIAAVAGTWVYYAGASDPGPTSTVKFFFT